MVLINVAFSSASQDATSNSSRVPVRWLRSPGVAKIWSQEGLFLGASYKQLLMICARSAEKELGMRSYTPRCTLVASPAMLVALKGGKSVTISYKTQPSDQMSDLLS